MMKLIEGLINLQLTFTLTIVFGSAYNPSVKIQMCTGTELSLTLNGAENGGVIYIKGHGSACKQDTNNTTTNFKFVFDACGIDPYVAFSVVVQKKPHYQTGSDLTVPVQCLYDINVGNQVLVKDVDNGGINITVRPTATMTLYSNREEVTAGQVDLTDVLTMSIQLDSDFMEDFDIKARHCSANTLEIVQDLEMLAVPNVYTFTKRNQDQTTVIHQNFLNNFKDCSTDTELFPNFAHPVQGVLSTTFGAFRTTGLNGRIVDMTFSCTLQLCFGACSETDCAAGEAAYDRQKRLADDDGGRKITVKRIADIDEHFVMRNKRAADDVAFKNINVGALISVGNRINVTETDDDYQHICVNIGSLVIFGALLCFIVVLLSFSLTSLICKYKKGQAKNSI